MAIRTILAPGVQINEIDKSGYSPAMVGTNVYLKGFSGKGEPYKFMEITTRAAFEQIYGAPDTEAERYFYAGACETLNQGGRLYAARLPYDNEAFEKMVGIKYSVTYGQNNIGELSSVGQQILSVDTEIGDIAFINGGRTPALYDLSAIDEFRTDEAKVPADTFLIVDVTNATYAKVTEDDRKGFQREVIGIIPVVTTAANALYAQNYINCELSDVQYYEPFTPGLLCTLIAKDTEGKVITIDGQEMQTSGLLSSDLTMNIAMGDTFGIHDTVIIKTLSCYSNYTKSIGDFWHTLVDLSDYPGTAEGSNRISIQNTAEELLNLVKSAYLSSSELSNLSVDGFSLSSSYEKDDGSTTSSTYYRIVYAPIIDLSVNNGNLANYLPYISADGYTEEGIKALFGYHEKNYNDAVPNTIGLNAANFFPAIQPAVDGNGLDPEHLKDIGVVVYKAYLDPAEGNKVSLEVVEAFAGSLYKDDKDPNTGVTKFIDTIINSQSKYINFFSNCFSSTNSKKYYKDKCDMLYAKPATGSCLGLYSPMTKKDISISKSILDGLNKCFDKVQDINLLDIDIVPDAGVSNIASYIKAIFGEKGPYDLSITDSLGNSLLGMWTCKKAADDHVKMWKTILMKYDNFCKNIRKDCMFIADGLRPLVLAGQKKIVRDTKPSNSIDKDILPFLPAICGLNSSYGAGYADWFEQADDYTGDFFWCPPSIKAMGCYINTDINFDYWLAPAGLTRGIIAATDVAFSPNAKQAGAFYEKNWNYAINYPQDGIVLEGQKTFQTKPTALDRVNVRRTMLRLERQVYKILRYFVYENNTAYTRQRVIDAIEPVLKACWQGGNGGLNRYKIVCDEKINDANTIDNNELKVQIGVVPNKSAEFIVCDFIIGAQSSTWAELLG